MKIFVRLWTIETLHALDEIGRTIFRIAKCAGMKRIGLKDAPGVGAWAALPYAEDYGHELAWRYGSPLPCCA
ncbi:MAG: hypothetical protein KTR19_12360 [Hyphomicrobiales bacterium]|nr:hypothetical protein [Hyphomicrobiales bacterium]